MLSIRQGEEESLWDYIGRFNVEVVSISRLQQDVAVLALMTGLRKGSTFRSYLDRKTFMSLGPVVGKANDFIRGEEFDEPASNQYR